MYANAVLEFLVFFLVISGKYGDRLARRAWGLALVHSFFVKGRCGARLAVVRGTSAVRRLAAQVFTCADRTGVNGGGSPREVDMRCTCCECAR
jgi:hypothetical protein